ncbi:uncharacterized protein EV420DRAFT_1487059 [Desarmillaria tabescens]|uniref:Uncharacterized protein n=1 Tax=Armillaria tabescens TaxID=1929756 RepID=A0AA39MJR6_ARMTA|nr:uncharacterized protein EV420DRAFT_1487059 [Desarmillaria tabescens]KAK0437446.1 hypothetical protein EV420DRAFT_1487059 [Desarmillaria tabescens]
MGSDNILAPLYIITMDEVDQREFMAILVKCIKGCFGHRGDEVHVCPNRSTQRRIEDALKEFKAMIRTLCNFFSIFGQVSRNPIDAHGTLPWKDNTATILSEAVGAPREWIMWQTVEVGLEGTYKVVLFCMGDRASIWLFKRRAKADVRGLWLKESIWLAFNLEEAKHLEQEQQEQVRTPRWPFRASVADDSASITGVNLEPLMMEGQD